MSMQPSFLFLLGQRFEQVLRHNISLLMPARDKTCRTMETVLFSENGHSSSSIRLVAGFRCFEGGILGLLGQETVFTGPKLPQPHTSRPLTLQR